MHPVLRGTGEGLSIGRLGSIWRKGGPSGHDPSAAAGFIQAVRLEEFLDLGQGQINFLAGIMP